MSQGYTSNLKSLMSMQDLKLVCIKSHDCHVIMKQSLFVAIQHILPSFVRGVNTIYKKVIDP